MSFDSVLKFFKWVAIATVAIFVIISMFVFVVVELQGPNVYTVTGTIIDITTLQSGTRTMIIESEDGSRISMKQYPASYTLTDYQRTILYQKMITSVVGDEVQVDYIYSDYMNTGEYRPVSFDFISKGW